MWWSTRQGKIVYWGRFHKFRCTARVSISDDLDKKTIWWRQTASLWRNGLASSNHKMTIYDRFMMMTMMPHIILNIKWGWWWRQTNPNDISPKSSNLWLKISTFAFISFPTLVCRLGEWRGLVVSTEDCRSKGRGFKSPSFLFTFFEFFPGLRLTLIQSEPLGPLESIRLTLDVRVR